MTDTKVDDLSLETGLDSRHRILVLVLTHRAVGVATFAITLGVIVALVLAPISWESLGGLGYLGLFILMVVDGTVMFMPGPAQVVAFLAAREMSPLMVGLIAGAGMGIGEMCSYILGRSGVSMADSSPGPKVSRWWQVRLKHLVTRYWFLLFFVFGAVPNPFIDASGILAGWYRLAIWKFLVPVIAGKMVRMTAIAYLGYWSLELLPF